MWSQLVALKSGQCALALNVNKKTVSRRSVRKDGSFGCMVKCEGPSVCGAPQISKSRNEMKYKGFQTATPVSPFKAVCDK